MSTDTQVPSRVRITASGLDSSLTIDGHDVSDQVRSYTLHHQAGQVPQLALLLGPSAADHWEGVAKVVVGVPPDPGPAAASFLEAIDAGELERTVLNRHDLMDGQPGEYTRAVLAQLTEWAAGRWGLLEEIA
ncbi:hypothetical protein E6W39_29190 [Kitasatospora acidiphila]|uniref:Uncharacterized protein n=1 Tax=Kitasatospora acidiphila TaxID=2567942 RepID=A0A540W956_9ACTN|nr:hypothetical protein [Kitasatospora acidiphila]TQF05560.1 hypothetical protein E6W39_29190 [Kitasatospora acidiphila]